jgi:outer membrane lipoprotein LolB
LLKSIAMGLFFATFFVAGCAVRTGAISANGADATYWRGRLAIQILSSQTPSDFQSMTAGFELTGNAKLGTLTLYTPLGSTVASLSWSPTTAVMRSAGETHYFESLDALIKHSVGTELPVSALFAWLAGNNLTMAGWSADLSQHSDGRITARRTQPEPLAEIRLVLEK